MDSPTKSWRYRCFVSARGEDVIDTWHATLSKKAKAALERTLEHLCVQPKSEWSRPHASPLKNHIYVIRFKDENRTQHRVAGHFTHHEESFVLSQPAIEKDDKYDPANITELAIGHKDVCDVNFSVRAKRCFHLDIHRAEDEQRRNELGSSQSQQRPVGNWIH